MLSPIAIIAAASALTAGASELLPTQSGWWERVEVTMADGSAPACSFTASHARAQSCDVATKASVSEAKAPGSTQLTKLTFERRFIPGAKVPGTVDTDVGDQLIGASLLELSIAPNGAVEHCKLVGRAGEVRPDFGCDEAMSERYAPSAARVHGYMTIAISGHREHVA